MDRATDNARAGVDFVRGLGGADLLVLGRGGDEATLADDAAVDVVDCGPGADTVTYYGSQDPLDVLTGCESVSVAP